MGGRGASSGVSAYGNSFGSQYRTVYQSGNIKFVTARVKNAESLKETMTRGRVYVRVDKRGSLREIVYFDNDGKTSKQIDLGHRHNGVKPHTHHGYDHASEDGPKGASQLTDKERSMVENVFQIWKNRKYG